MPLKNRDRTRDNERQMAFYARARRRRHNAENLASDRDGVYYCLRVLCPRTLQ